MIDPGAQQLLVAFETAFQSKVTIPILLLDVILMFCLGCVRPRKPRLGALDGTTIQTSRTIVVVMSCLRLRGCSFKRFPVLFQSRRRFFQVLHQGRQEVLVPGMLVHQNFSIPSEPRLGTFIFFIPCETVQN